MFNSLRKLTLLTTNSGNFNETLSNKLDNTYRNAILAGAIYDLCLYFEFNNVCLLNHLRKLTVLKTNSGNFNETLSKKG